MLPTSTLASTRLFYRMILCASGSGTSRSGYTVIRSTATTLCSIFGVFATSELQCQSSILSHMASVASRYLASTSCVGLGGLMEKPSSKSGPTSALLRSRLEKWVLLPVMPLLTIIFQHGTGGKLQVLVCKFSLQFQCSLLLLTSYYAGIHFLRSLPYAIRMSKEQRSVATAMGETYTDETLETWRAMVNAWQLDHSKPDPYAEPEACK